MLPFIKYLLNICTLIPELKSRDKDCLKKEIFESVCIIFLYINFNLTVKKRIKLLQDYTGKYNTKQHLLHH